MGVINDNLWNRYSAIVTNFINEDAGNQVIVWKRAITQPQLYGEDSSGKFYPDIEIEVLLAYNFFRAWPINKATTSGELDNQNCVIWVSLERLAKMELLDEHGYPMIDFSLDRFVIKGKVYKSSGDTDVAQAKDKPLLFTIILKREEEGEIK